MLKSTRLVCYSCVILFLITVIDLSFSKSVVFGFFSNTASQRQQAPESTNNQEKPAEHLNAQTSDTIKRIPGAAPNFRSKVIDRSAFSKREKDFSLTRALSRMIGVLQPNQGGIVWMAVIATVLIAFNFKNLISLQNADVLLILLLSFLLIDVIYLGDGVFQGSVRLPLLSMVFLGIFLVGVAIFFRSLIGAFAKRERQWTPNLSNKTLIVLAVFFLSCNVLFALSHFPDDCGMYSNLGSSRILETGNLPYGDSTLRGGAASTYGPVLYFAHIPFHLVFSFIDTNALPSDSSLINWIAMGGRSYSGPPILVTKLTLLSFHFLCVFGLIIIGRRLGGSAIGWGLVCLYAGSAYVQGLGGDDLYITGMTYISHIAPASITILAFALLGRPFWSGTLLAVAAGILFYPVFLFPLWFGYYFWQRKEWGKFASGFTIVCVIILIAVFLMTEHNEGESVLSVIHECTVGHQESKEAYGSSTFSFWGTHPRLASFWQEPLIKNWYLFKPTFMIFVIFIGASFFLVRNRTETQLSLLIVAVVISIQLWKSHAGGTYVEWYLPFLLIGLFGKHNKEHSVMPENST